MQQVDRVDILTSAASMGGPGSQATGVWLEEFATPFYTFVDSGAKVTVASILGGAVPIDPGSLKPRGQNEPSVERLLNDAQASRTIQDARRLDDLHTEDFDAVFLPGGHGTMWDLPNSHALAEFLSKAWSQGKVIAAVCHGPAGLVGAKDEAGQPLVKGRRVTSFTDSEEHVVGLENTVPFLLESRIRELGGRFEKAEDFNAFAIADGRLVTGQNPASSERVAELTLKALASKV